MKTYNFYGWEQATVPAITNKYKGIHTPQDLYDRLSDIWCADTCASRLRDGWTPENKTLGQCSITAFLVQDIFGGKVYGILRPGGNYHCYNDVNGHIFDLTSEQFGDETLSYKNNPEQFREVHFAKEEKRLNGEIKRCEGMLGNERFVSKAPEAKVQEEKDKLAKYQQMLEQVKEQIARIS